MISERVRRLKEAVVNARPELFAERARLVTESYRATEGEPIEIRRGKMLAHILDRSTVSIREGELVVGVKTPTPLGSPVYPEVACTWLEEELDTISERRQAPFHVSEENRMSLREIIPYWRGKQTFDRIVESLPDEVKAATDEGVFFHYYLNRTIGHITVDYEKVLRKGFAGIKKDILNAMDRVDYQRWDCLRSVNTLKGMLITCDAAIAFAARYADLARRLAAEEGDPGRRAELLTIAGICERVPGGPARTFYESVQSFWFVHLILNLESNAYAISPGRFDQYIYPYYRDDLKAGRITPDQAQEIMDCLWVKFAELTVAKEAGTAKASNTYTDFQNLNLGGLTAEGLDAANDLSFMCLESTRRLQLPQPQVSVLVSARTSDEFLLKTCEVIRLGFGIPSVVNDDEKVMALMDKGKTLLDSRGLGGVNGCVELNVQGKDSMASSGYLNLALCLDLALNNGISRASGKELGPATGYLWDYRSFDELFEGFRRQLEHFVGVKVIYDGIARAVFADFCPVPFTSILIDDCIEKARDYHAGGAHYNLPLMCGVGTGTVTDSLAAIKKFVFEEGRIGPRDLMAALQADFAGHEPLRQILSSRAPKFGNDDDYADSIAHRVVSTFSDVLSGFRNGEGVPYVANMIPTTTHIPFGAVVGATPDGRKAGAPLSEGVSPVQGQDRHGPSAVINSVTRLDHARCCGTLLNMKFHPSLVAGDEGLRNLASLIRAYFDLGGHHMQFNVISAETLRKAQANPEEYRTLIIRVAGYSDYFINLSRELQDEIISRTEHMSF